ncbi:ADA17-like protein, partial [Mya arenaria]
HPKCGAIHPEVEQGGDDDEDEIEVAFNQHSSGEGQRAKRAVGEKTCQVAAIADYRFYEHMGRSSIFKTANYIVISTFTAQSYSGVLSLYIHSPVLQWSYKLGPTVEFKARSYSGVLRHFNTGWSSSKNGAGSTVTFDQQALLAAHEFGHSLGSEHDPSSGDCAPGSLLGDGKYLMYTYTVSGEDPNNGKFSSCSINRMNEVLSTKSSCFVAGHASREVAQGIVNIGERSPVYAILLRTHASDVAVTTPPLHVPCTAMMLLPMADPVSRDIVLLYI